ncbi:MAG: DUF4347 domain-containing protein, partial [Magnetococcales bacterium]|nr:DUF4347 domain-containing protein [Magnetococcales bacterium]
MFDGAAVTTFADATHDAAQDTHSDLNAEASRNNQSVESDPSQVLQEAMPSSTPTDPIHPAPLEVRGVDPTLNQGRKEVAFIDTSVANYQTLVDGVRPGVAVVLIDGNASGVAQLSQWAETHSGYDAIHILSHGTEATLRLGRDVLTSASLQSSGVQADLALLGQSLTESGDLMIYGCDIASGEAGQAFVANLAAATGADVGASSDATGAATGDWQLEFSTGLIQTESQDIPSYTGLLAAPADQDFSAATATNGSGITSTVTLNNVSYTLNAGKIDVNSNPATHLGIDSFTGLSDNAIVVNYDKTLNGGALTRLIISSSNLANDFKLNSLVMGINDTNYGMYTFSGYDGGINGTQIVSVSPVDLSSADATFGIGRAAITYDQRVSTGNSWGGLLTFGAAWDRIDTLVIEKSNNYDLCFALDSIDFSSATISSATITSATYNASTGVMTVTTSGASNDDVIDLSKLSFKAGTDGSSALYYSTTTTATVSSNQFSFTIGNGDNEYLNRYYNKNGTTSSSGQSYTIEASAGWIVGALADTSGNTVTVSSSSRPEVQGIGTIDYYESVPTTLSTFYVFNNGGDAKWNGATMSLQINSNSEATDKLYLSTTTPTYQDGVWIETGTHKIKYSTNASGGFVQIGTANADFVTGSATWTFTFNANATNARVKTFLQQVYYDDTSATPSVLPRTVTLSVTDADSASASDTIRINVRAVDTLGGTGDAGSLKVVDYGGSIQVYKNTGTAGSPTWVYQKFGDTMPSAGSYLHTGSGAYALLSWFSNDPTSGIQSPASWATPTTHTVTATTMTDTWSAGSFTIQQVVTLADPADQYIRYDWTITNNSGSAVNDLRFFTYADTYLDGGDAGAGVLNTHVSGASTIIDFVGVTKTTSGVNQKLGWIPITQPSHYFSGYYWQPSGMIAVSDPRLGDIINPDVTVDNGYAVEWDKSSISAGESWTISTFETFSAASVIAGSGDSNGSGASTTYTGSSTTVMFNVTNYGNAQNITYSITAPTGWTVTLDKASDSNVAQNAVTTVTATISGVGSDTTGTFNLTLRATGADNTTSSAIDQVAVALPIGPTVTLSVNNATIAEAAGTSTVTATLSAAAASDTTVTLTASGTATGGGTDYSLSSTTITILAGQTTGTATLTAVQDTRDEVDETIILDITGVSGGGGATESGTQQQTVTITDDDAAPTVSIDSPSVTEGNSGTTALTYTVTLSAASGKSITVDYATSNGTATSGTDYTATSGTLTFAAGDTSKTFTVTVAGDATTEGDETITATLSNASNVTLGTSTGTGTITDDDNPAPTLTATGATPTFTEGGAAVDLFSVVAASTNESGMNFTGMTVTVTNVADSTEYLTIGGVDVALTNGNSVTVSGGTAAVGVAAGTATVTLTGLSLSDANMTTLVDGLSYKNSSDTPTTASSRVVTITGITDNSSANSSAAPNRAATVTVAGVNPTITLSVNNATIAEAAGSSTITATQSVAAQHDTVITLTATGTGTGTTDYTLSLTTITILAGQTTGTATVTAVQDTLDEVNETVILDITNVTGGGGAVESGTQQRTVTITDDDNPPTVSINSPTHAEGNSGSSNMSFTVSLSAASSKSITIYYATANGTATAGSDYTATTGTLTLAPGDTSKTFNVAVLGDVTTESDETIDATISITSPTVPDDATLGTATGTGTITDDDNPAPTLTATGATPTFTEGGAAVDLFSVVAASTNESGMNFTGMTVTVTNVADSTEYLTIGGVDVALTNGNSVTVSGGTAAVGVAAGTATVTLTGLSLSDANMTTLVDGLSYKNSSDTPTTASSRVVTITGITDNSSANSSAAPNRAATVTVAGVNPTITLSVNNATIAEAAGSSTITATQSVAAQHDTVITLTATGTGTGTTDYTLSLTTITILAGQTTGTATVTAVQDTLDEVNETVILDITNVTGGGGAVESGTQQRTVTITDDDPEPMVSFDSPSVTEGSSGTTTTLTFTATLNAASGKSITVDYATRDGFAIAGTDYTAVNGTLTFAPGQTTKTIDVTVIGNNDTEISRAFLLDLSNLNNAQIDTSTVQGTITDDDNAAPTLTTIANLTGATEDTAHTITYADLAAAANEADSENDPISFRIEAVSSGTLTKGGVAVVTGTTMLGTGESLVWTPAANANGTLGAFTVKAHDTHSASASAVAVNVVVGAVNDKPVVTAGASLAYTENGSAAAIDTTVTIVDVDDTQLTGATVSITSGRTTGDLLVYTGGSPGIAVNPISGSFDSATGVLTLTGTASLAQYQAALRAVTFVSTSEDPTASSATRTVTWAVTDANSDSSSAQTSTSVTSTINVTATADKPVVTAGASLAYTENGSAAAIDTSVTITDVDDTQLTGATVSITSGR